MRIYKLLLILLTSLALAGCGSKAWDWFFDDEEEEVAYEEEEVMVDEGFDEEDEENREEDEYEYEYEDVDGEEDDYDEYEDERDRRKPSRRDGGRGMSRYGDEPEYDDGRDDGRRAAGRTPGRMAIYFDYKKNVIPANGINLLQLHAQFLKANPNAVVTIEGHTDSVAPADYNKTLGLRRAQSVADTLVDMGVSPAQIVTVSYGEERPAQPGESESANAMNRRVELAY